MKKSFYNKNKSFSNMKKFPNKKNKSFNKKKDLQFLNRLFKILQKKMIDIFLSNLYSLKYLIL